MLTEDKVNRVHNFGGQSQPSWGEGRSTRCTESATEKLLLFEIVMFPETDELSNIISDTVKVVFKRRLVDRVLRLWTEIARGQGFPRRDQIEPAMLGVDWLNCLIIAVKSPVRLSTFVYVGENLSFTRCLDESLAGVLLSHLPQVLSERRCLMIEGRARLREIGILYRSALYPLSDDGIAIDHVLGAANCRPLRENEHLRTPLVRTKWL
jgi:hypothetical protein